MNFVAVLIALFYLCDKIFSNDLRIVRYNNVTLSTCGLNAFSSKPSTKKCFKWHQTMIEEQKTLRNIKYGRFADIEEYPYNVLLKRGNPWCGGAIINEKWIITAAHCLAENHNDIQIYTGITNYPQYSLHPINAKNFYLHENYSTQDILKMYDNNIALIKLDTKLDISINKANGVCLPAPEYNIRYSEELATFTGWGYISDDERNLKQLKMAQIKLGDAYYDRSYSIITVKNTKYGQACKSDSGGPLVQYVDGRAVLIGIYRASLAVKDPHKACPEIQSMFFAAVPYHLNWIIEAMRKN